MFVFEQPGERVIAMMTSGNLSITQTVMAKLKHEIDRADSTPATSILKAETMLDAAEIVGETLFDVAIAVRARMRQMDQSASASIMLGGQRKGGEMRLFYIYREGNFIEATPDTPVPADRRVQVRQADPRPGGAAVDLADRGPQGGAAVDGLDDALEPVGGHAARPGDDPARRLSGDEPRADRAGRSDVQRDVRGLEPSAARQLHQHAGLRRLARHSA